MGVGFGIRFSSMIFRIGGGGGEVGRGDLFLFLFWRLGGGNGERGGRGDGGVFMVCWNSGWGYIHMRGVYGYEIILYGIILHGNTMWDFIHLGICMCTWLCYLPLLSWLVHYYLSRSTLFRNFILLHAMLYCTVPSYSLPFSPLPSSPLLHILCRSHATPCHLTWYDTVPNATRDCSISRIILYGMAYT